MLCTNWGIQNLVTVVGRAAAVPHVHPQRFRHDSPRCVIGGNGILQNLKRSEWKARIDNTGAQVIDLSLASASTSVSWPRLVHDCNPRLRRTKNLVKLLAVAPGRRLHREHVMEVLGPDQGTRSCCQMGQLSRAAGVRGRAERLYG